MKFLTILSLASTALAANQFYDSKKDVTCHGDETSGDIVCEEGHLNDAPELDAAGFQSVQDDLAARSLDKRLTCGIDISGVSACLGHCYLIGYCNSYCDQGICHCRCYDEAPYLCINTTCN